MEDVKCQNIFLGSFLEFPLGCLISTLSYIMTTEITLSSRKDHGWTGQKGFIFAGQYGLH